jgi:hypothetical protein
MNIMDTFPSSYLKAADLNGKSYKLKIKEVLMEEIGGEHKAILYFQNTDKGVVLNKTNATAIADVHGPDTDGWNGKEVEVFPATTMFKGQTVPCIRLRGMAPAADAGAVPGGKRRGAAVAAAMANAGVAPAPAAKLTELDDDIPF